MSAHVSQLFHFPVKSLKGIRRNQMTLDTFGPQWDRRFMLVDTNGRFITQRQCPLMGQINVNINDNTLTLCYGREEKAICLSTLSLFTNRQQVTVWGDHVDARLIEGDINRWLSHILNRDVTLCFMDDSTHRQVDVAFAKRGDRASFADGFPLLIISEASVDFLSTQLGRPLSIERFRANIVVAGCDAFAEDQWKKIAINGVEFDIVKPCSRCVIPTLDLDTSEKQPDVMQVMLTHRKQGKQVMMGQNAIHRSVGSLSVGSAIKILA